MLGTKGTRRISSLESSTDGGMAKIIFGLSQKSGFTPIKNVDFLGR